MKSELWAREAKLVLGATIKRSGLTYQQLAGRLTEIGVEETVASIKNKMRRGTFSFVFVLQVLKALDRNRLDVG